MKVLFYAAKAYDKKSFGNALPGFPEISIDYVDYELEPRSATLAKGYDAICAFVSADVGAETLTVLKEGGVKVVLMRCAGFNNVDIEKAKELGIPTFIMKHMTIADDDDYEKVLANLKQEIVDNSLEGQFGDIKNNEAVDKSAALDFVNSL